MGDAVEGSGSRRYCMAARGCAKVLPTQGKEALVKGGMSRQRRDDMISARALMESFRVRSTNMQLSRRQGAMAPDDVNANSKCSVVGPAI